jgi:diguanylate cyclase (GGDEF)-like protein/PAS domain S-box-containing protein
MASVPRFDALARAPLDVRDPDVVAALAEAVAILDADLRPRMLMGDIGRRAGFLRADDVTTRLADWVHPDDHPILADALARSQAAPGVDIDAVARVHNDVDGWHTMRLGFRNLLGHPDVQGILLRAVDQTVHDREARWRVLVSESPVGIYEQDLNGACTFVNPAFGRILEMAAEDALGFGWTTVVHPEDLAKLREIQNQAVPLFEPRAVELRLLRSDGTQRWVSARSVALRDDEGTTTGFLGTLEDVTERHRLEERLEYDATHDRLTGLGSRALLVAQMNSALARARRGDRAVALLFIDLDGFKRVNDMLGHAAGDELLVQVAQRLQASVREGDVCVRLGGDEFVVCCTDMEPLVEASKLAERVLLAVAEPYDVHGHEVLVGASIGIATAQGEDPVSADQLLSNADLAAYRAKRRGRGRVEVFDDDLRRRLSQSRRIGRSVARLLDEPTLPILCAPLAYLGNGGIVGFDCTVDWTAAGLHDGDAIDHVIEEAGMSRALDLALIRTLLAQLGEWERRAPGAIVPGLSMTLTRASAISPVMGELIRDMLARSGVVPSLCWIGVPESAVAHDLEAASHVAAALDGLGVGVALRDFGSAVSSLEQLRQLPAPTMTVAGPLVAALHGTQLTDEEVQATLLAAIVKYARALGRIVVATDLQDVDHALRLRDLGCEFGAGPVFGPALRPDQIEEFLATR